MVIGERGKLQMRRFIERAIIFRRPGTRTPSGLCLMTGRVLPVSVELW